MRILITGAGGQVGREIASLIGADRRFTLLALNRADLDVTDRGAVLGAVTSFSPDAVIHPAAWTAVDACEADPDRAHVVNALGSRNVAEAASRVGATMCYLSTDYVFDGTKPGPYNEWDQPNPRSVYGASKLAGEREVLAVAPAGALIVRTSWVCGFHGNNMVKTVLRLADEPGVMRFVDDQRGKPTFAPDLALALQRLVVERRTGLFNVANAGATTWYQFARDVLAAAGLDTGRVEPISTAELDPPRPAPRPVNSVLDDVAWRSSGLPRLRDHHEPLAELVARLRP